MEPVEIFDGEIKVDWDLLRVMSETSTETCVYKCKKCGASFFNKNYYGKYPMCDKHMLKTPK